jgi:hypothetical protein
MAATNKCLAQSNKSCAEGRAAKKSICQWTAAQPRVMTPALAAPKTSRLRTRTALPSCSDLPIPGRTGMNPSHHGSDEQMFGAKQQVLHRGLVD